MKQLSIYETDYLEDLNTLNHFSQPPEPLAPTALANQSTANSRQAEPAAANVTEIIIAKDKADSIYAKLKASLEG